LFIIGFAKPRVGSTEFVTTPQRSFAIVLTKTVNAMCESFNATLECELLVKHRFRTQRNAEAAVFDFIEAWYNPHRRHSALDYLSPINFERRAKTAA
jgi:transposase InsO family protein